MVIRYLLFVIVGSEFGYLFRSYFSNVTNK